MIDVLRILGAVGPFLLAVKAVSKANAAKIDRYHQLLLPAIALIFGLYMILTLEGWHHTIQAALSFLSRFISRYIILPFDLKSSYIEAIAFNTIILVEFAVIKKAYVVFIKRAEQPYESIGKVVFGRIYKYDEEFNHWYLRTTLHGIRRLFRNMFVATVAISLALFLAVRFFSHIRAFQNPFYPALATILLGELYYFLDGMTKEEYRQQVVFEDDHAVRISQYAKIQKSLEHYFPDRLLGAFSQGRRRATSFGHSDLTNSLMHSANFNERLAGTYFNALTQKNLLSKGFQFNFGDLNHDMVLNTIKLLEGKSVLFASPFYRDYLPYVFLPINSHLIRGAKVLVLCESMLSDVVAGEFNKEGIAQFMRDGLKFVTNVPDMWDVEQLNTDKNPDVGIMPFSMLGDVKTIVENSAFFEQTSFVLVLDPFSMLATYQIGLGILAERLSRGHEVTYCIFDKNGDGLVDALSHAFRTNLVEVGATEYCEGSSVGMLWDTDGEFLQHRLFPDVAHYLGMAPEIGLVALRGQVPRVSWVARDTAPVLDQRWILGQYYGELFGFAQLPQEQAQIDEHFEFYPDIWSMRKQENRFIVVEDEFSNLFEAYRQFSTRATNHSFVNVLSPNYLLRSYMVDNADMLTKDPKALPALAPEYSKSERNVVFSIVMMMVQAERSIPVEEIEALLRYAGVLDNRRSIKEALEGMMLEHFPPGAVQESLDEQLIVRTVAEYNPAIRDYEEHQYYEIGKQARYLPAFRSLRNVPLVTEAPDGTELLLGSRLYDQLYQLFLPGQFTIIEGKYYEVLSISDDVGVVLRRAADHFTRRRYYRQLRHYTVSDWNEDRAPASTRSIGDIVVQLGGASIEVMTEGYLDMRDYGNIESAIRVELSDVPSRSYRNKNIVRLDFRGASREVVTTLAVLISESFKTLFPKDYPFLAVLAPCAELQEGILYKCACPDEPSSVYIVEDSFIDLGLLASVHRNIPRILELCWEFLDWHEEMLDRGPQEISIVELGECPSNPDPPLKKEGLLRKILTKICSLFRRKSKNKDSLTQKEQDEDANTNDSENTDVVPPSNSESSSEQTLDVDDDAGTHTESEQDAIDESPSQAADLTQERDSTLDSLTSQNEKNSPDEIDDSCEDEVYDSDNLTAEIAAEANEENSTDTSEEGGVDAE